MNDAFNKVNGTSGVAAGFMKPAIAAGFMKPTTSLNEPTPAGIHKRLLSQLVGLVDLLAPGQARSKEGA